MARDVFDVAKGTSKSKQESADLLARSFIVCTGGKTCSKGDGPAIYKALKRRLAGKSSCSIEKSGCLKHCRFSSVVIAPGGEVLGRIEKSDIKTIVKRYLKAKKPPKRLRLAHLK